jgi:hypothetical protein
MVTDTTPEQEAFIQREIERAVAPYSEIAPPSMMAMLRRVAEQYWRTHPQGIAIVRALTRSDTDQSQRNGSPGSRAAGRPSGPARRKARPRR